MKARNMKLVETISQRPDPWFGNNLLQVFEDDQGKFWFVTNNDAYPPDHPDYQKVLYEARKETKTYSQWVKA